jgi:CheY-like chemotaxis protein
LAKNCKVDLVVLDYEMPRMTGAEIAERLRAVQPTVTIIMISGTELPEESPRVVDCFVPNTQMVTTLKVNRFLRNRKAACE